MTDPQYAASAVLAAGQTLPVGMTLARTRITLAVPNPSLEDPDAVRWKRRRMITGSFVAGGDPIIFEVIRGDRISHEEGPKYEIDVCFRDSEGTPFVAQYGGHGAMDPTCDVHTVQIPDGEEIGTSTTFVQTAAAVSTAQAAIAALGGVEFKRSLATEYQALMAQGSMLESFAEVTDDDCSAPDMFCEPEAEVGGQSSWDYQWKHRLHVYSGWAFHLPYLVGDHSSTRAYMIHQVWGTALAWTRCNHGRCPNESGMVRVCRMQSGYDRQAHVHEEYCSTKYRLFSGAIGTSTTSSSKLYGRGHNCNDDVIMQQAAVRLDTHFFGGYGSGFPCDDTLLNNFTPGCYW